MSKADKSIELLSEVIKTCQAIGFKKTLEANISARKNTEHIANIEQDRICKENLIVTEVCKLFNVTYDELMKKCSRGSRKDAQTVAYVYLKAKMQYSLKDIQKIFGCDTSQASKYITFFYNLSATDRYDKIILDKYTALEEILKDKLK